MFPGIPFMKEFTHKPFVIHLRENHSISLMKELTHINSQKPFVIHLRENHSISLMKKPYHHSDFEKNLLLFFPG